MTKLTPGEELTLKEELRTLCPMGCTIHVIVWKRDVDVRTIDIVRFYPDATQPLLIRKIWLTSKVAELFHENMTGLKQRGSDNIVSMTLIQRLGIALYASPSAFDWDTL